MNVISPPGTLLFSVLIWVGMACPAHPAATPANNEILLGRPEVTYTIPAAKTEYRQEGLITVPVEGVAASGAYSLIRYEIDCQHLTFRQLEVLETFRGTVSRCTTPSEPIQLRTGKHTVPEQLFKRFCPGI